jgi:hypothetical protein
MNDITFSIRSTAPKICFNKIPFNPDRSRPSHLRAYERIRSSYFLKLKFANTFYNNKIINNKIIFFFPHHLILT